MFVDLVIFFLVERPSAKNARIKLMLSPSLFVFFFFCWRYLQVRGADLQSPNFPIRWQIGFNGKVKRLVSEPFRGGKEVQKGQHCA